MKKYHNPSFEIVSIDTKDIMQTSVTGDKAGTYIGTWGEKLDQMDSDWGMDA